MLKRLGSSNANLVERGYLFNFVLGLCDARLGDLDSELCRAVWEGDAICTYTIEWLGAYFRLSSSPAYRRAAWSHAMVLAMLRMAGKSEHGWVCRHNGVSLFQSELK